MSFTCFNPFTVNPYFHTFPREKIPAQKMYRDYQLYFQKNPCSIFLGSLLCLCYIIFPDKQSLNPHHNLPAALFL